MLITLKSPTLVKAWGEYREGVMGTLVVLLFIAILVSIPPAIYKYALVDGVYYKWPIRCNFGVLRDSSGPILDFDDNKIRCVSVAGEAGDIRLLGEIR